MMRTLGAAFATISQRIRELDNQYAKLCKQSLSCFPLSMELSRSANNCFQIATSKQANQSRRLIAGYRAVCGAAHMPHVDPLSSNLIDLCNLIDSLAFRQLCMSDLSTIKPIDGLIGERARCRDLHAFTEHKVPRARSNRNQAADRLDC
jgi:hypothetical protein